jgi:UDP-GlcNAc:undecaprenyl-phosphate GlcNAc-1-phosphate transferase
VTFVPSIGAALPALVVAFLAAAALSYALTPGVRRLAVRFGAIDRPSHRRVNTSPVPRGGGLAVAAAFLLVATTLVALNAQLHFVALPTTLRNEQLLALLLGGAIAASLGAIDDYVDLRARWQLAFQLALAGFAVGLGVVIAAVNNPFGPGVIRLQPIFAIAFTILWIVGMINSINFVDGLDGLSAGIGLIAAVTLGLISLTTQIGQPFVAMLCLAFAGSLAGFLRWNFHPAAIFIGTSGVFFVGYTLALLSIAGTAKVAVALLVLGVPIIDTFWIIVRRIVQGRSPFSPDRGHLHHRLLDLGLSHRQTVLLIYAICVGLGVLSLVLSGADQLYAFLGVFVVIGIVLLVLARGGFVADELEADTYEDRPPAA